MRRAALVVVLAAVACGRLEVGIDVPDAGIADANEGCDDDANRCLPPDHGWLGCSPSGCTICSEQVVGFPLYFENHERCEPTDDCHKQYSTCSSDCPQPDEADQCDGTEGQWQGCRGSGCWVCAELVKDYPKYFDRHRNCIRNDGCEGVFYPCSKACPAPEAADK